MLIKQKQFLFILKYYNFYYTNNMATFIIAQTPTVTTYPSPFSHLFHKPHLPLYSSTISCYKFFSKTNPYKIFILSPILHCYTILIYGIYDNSHFDSFYYYKIYIILCTNAQTYYCWGQNNCV